MPDAIISVDITANTAGLKAGLAEAGAATTAVQGPVNSLAAAQGRLAVATENANAIMASCGNVTQEGTAAYEAYQAAAQEVADAQAAVAAATAAAAASQDALSMSTAAATEATARGTRSFMSSDYAMAYGTARIASYAGGLRGMGFVMARIGAMSETLQPILASMFSTAIAGTFVYLLAEGAAALKKWYDNAVLLRGALADVLNVDISLGNQLQSSKYKLLEAEAAQARLDHQMTRYVAIVHEMQSLSPEAVSIKIKQGDLDTLHKAGIDVRTLINTIQNTKTLGGLQGLLPRISASLTEVRKRMAALRQEHADSITAPGGTAMMVQSVESGMTTRTTATIEAAQRIAMALERAQQIILTQSSAAHVTMQNKLHESFKAHAEHMKGVAGSTFRNPFAESLRETTAEIAATTGAHTTGSQRVSMAYQQHSAAHAAAMAKVTEEYRQGKISAAEFQRAAATYDRLRVATAEEAAAEMEQIERQLLEKKRELIEQEARMVSDEQAKELARATRNEMAHLRILQEESRRIIAEKMRQERAQEMQERQAARKQEEQAKKASDKIAGALMEGMSRRPYAWADAFARLWNNALQTSLQAGLQSTISMIMTRASMMANSQAQAGVATQTSADHQTQLSASKVVFANVYKVISGIPLVGPFIAPPLAAAAAAEVAAFAKGGIVPETSLALVHKNEMVLPSHIASFVRDSATRNAPGSGIPGDAGQMHFHYAPSVQAIDQSGVKDMLDRHASLFASSMMRWARGKNMA